MAPAPEPIRQPFLLAATTHKKKHHRRHLHERSAAFCFSFAAYAKTLIHHLHTACNVPVLPGLSDAEFAAIEASLGFAFPPDLHAVLREGLPSAAGFPNWRSPSSLPHLLLHISDIKFPWPSNLLGPRPKDPDEAQLMAQKHLTRAPILVPIYRHFYIPSTPDAASGNPIFSVHGGAIELAGFDLSGFFHRILESDRSTSEIRTSFSAPAWAAKEARRIEVWTELAEETERRRRRRVERSRVWWWGGDELGSCLEEVVLKLRKAGWGEEEVREMMMMDGGDDAGYHAIIDDPTPIKSVKYTDDEAPIRGVGKDDGMASTRSAAEVGEDDDMAPIKGGVGKNDDVAVAPKASVRKDDEVEEGWHVRELSTKLLRAGWSAEDVAYSLGLNGREGGNFFLTRVANTWTQIQHRRSGSQEMG